MLANLINKNNFSALGDAEEKSGATVSTAAQFNNPKSGHGGVSTKKTLFGQFHSAEGSSKQTYLNGNDLYRSLGQRSSINKIKTWTGIVSIAARKTALTLSARFIRARFISQSQTNVENVHIHSKRGFSLIFPSPDWGKRFLLFSTFPSFNNLNTF